MGARIVRLEVLMRATNPILRLGKAVIEPLVRQTGCDALISNTHGEQIFNVLHERGVEQLDLTFLSGHPLPLFRGATSKAILAFLPTSRLLRLYEAHAREIAQAGLGASWKEFWQYLQSIRAQGHFESRGELDAGIAGFGWQYLTVVKCSEA